MLNEGAGGLLAADGKHLALDVQAGEKVYQDFALETTNPGGHSARPVRDNAINQLAAGLTRLAAYQFPITWNQTTRAYFEAQAGMASPEVARDIRAVLANPQDAAAADRLWTTDPGWNGMMRTTCTATQIEGGHAPNALPQRARANVNCRILPGVPIEAVQEDLRRVVADDGIRDQPSGNRGLVAPVPPLTPQIMEPVNEGCGGPVARRADHPDDERGRDGRAISQRRGHSDLRAVRHVPRRGWQPGARDRTSASACSRCWTGGGSCTRSSGCTRSSRTRLCRASRRPDAGGARFADRGRARGT